MLYKKTDILPWYKQAYVWLIILFPSLAVFGGIITIILAVNSEDGLVVDDYYKQGLEINRVLERDQQAQAYQLDADINIDPTLEEIAIKLTAMDGFNFPEQLSVKFLHATRSGFDRDIKLILSEAQTYRGNLAILTAGKWYVHIQQDEWRLIETIIIN